MTDDPRVGERQMRAAKRLVELLGELLPDGVDAVPVHIRVRYRGSDGLIPTLNLVFEEKGDAGKGALDRERFDTDAEYMAAVVFRDAAEAAFELMAGDPDRAQSLTRATFEIRFWTGDEHVSCITGEMLAVPVAPDMTSAERASAALGAAIRPSEIM